MSGAASHGYAEPRPRWGRRVLVAAGVLALLAVAYVVVQLVRSPPALTATASPPTTLRVGGSVPRLPWPSQGSAAVEVVGVGSLGSFHGTTARPLASVTKLMTALVVLKRHPLAAGDGGPTIRISAADVVAYRADLASDQSVLKVSAGEQLDELQALEGLLVPSANNLAPILARWDAGSVGAFVARMNATARELGLEHTHFVEPSGIAAGDVGSALDMVRLGAAALANPTIAAIVRLGEVELPVAGTVINYDYEVGHHGIIGIKTGSSSAAGGNFVFAARRRLDGRTLTVVGSVLGQEGVSRLQTALDAGERLATAAFGSVRSLTVTRAGAVVIHVRAPWSPRAVSGVTTETVRYFGVPGANARVRIAVAGSLVGRRVRSLASGTRIGTLTVAVAGRRFEVPVVASSGLAGPSLHYRLTRL